jgi:hypothetical protein
MQPAGRPRVPSRTTHVQRASASSIIKIWIVLAASVLQHLPLSRHTSPLPPNAFPLPKHIPTHTTPPADCHPFAFITAAKQKHRRSAAASGLASATWNMTCRLPSDLAPPLSPTQTQNTNFVLVGPAQPRTSPRISLFRVCGTGTAFRGLCPVA